MIDVILPVHLGWAERRVPLAHNWLYPLGRKLLEAESGAPPRDRAPGAQPREFYEWVEKAPQLRAWLEEALEALSPAQVFDLDEFDAWGDAEFRDGCRKALDRRFRETSAGDGRPIKDLVADCLQRLDALAPLVRKAREEPGRVGGATRQLAADVIALADLIHQIPRHVVWPEPAAVTVEDDLPHILVVDDTLGRLDLQYPGGAEAALGPAAYGELVRYRRDFCERLGVLDLLRPEFSEGIKNPIARATFCPAQSWDDEKGIVQDNLAPLERAMRGRRYALACVDVVWTHGRIGPDGHGESHGNYGLRVMAWLRDRDPDLRVVALSNEVNRDIVLDVHEVADEYVNKLDVLISKYILIQIKDGGRASLSQLRRAMGIDDHLIAKSPAMLETLFRAWEAGNDPTGGNVLILGPPGSGKEKIANYIHDISSRGDRDIVVFDCPQFANEKLARSQLFGFYKGAFEDADATTPGLVHKADGSTLFMDEFGDLPDGVQTQFLRFLGSRGTIREVHPEGRYQKGQKDTLDTEVDVRVVCATCRELDGLRKDLVDRVVRHIIQVPPLDDREEDIIPLAEYFLRRRPEDPQRLDRQLSLSPDAKAYLLSQDLDRSRNVRGLEHLMDNVALRMSERNIVHRKHLIQAQAAAVAVTRASRGGPQEASAPAAKAAPPAPAVGAIDSLPEAVRELLLIDGAWSKLSGDQVARLDAQLRGKVLHQAVAILLRWALHRSTDFKGFVAYLVGVEEYCKPAERMGFVKRLLKLDLALFRSLHSDERPSNPKQESTWQWARGQWDQQKSEEKKASTPRQAGAGAKGGRQAG